jgi:hypothetical protein
LNKPYMQAQPASIHDTTNRAVEADRDKSQRRLNASIRLQLARLAYEKATKDDLQRIVLRALEAEIETLETA